MDNMTTFGILEPWQSTFHVSAWLGLGLLFPRLVCLPAWVVNLLAAVSELVKGTGLELSPWLQKKEVKSFLISALSFTVSGHHADSN